MIPEWLKTDGKERKGVVKALFDIIDEFTVCSSSSSSNEKNKIENMKKVISENASNVVETFLKCISPHQLLSKNKMVT